MEHPVEALLMLEAIPPFEIDHDMRQVHHGAMSEVAIGRLIRVSGNRLEAR
jgi:hypothetical protein